MAQHSHVFISYVTENFAAAEMIAGVLRDAGVNVWMDHTHLVGGQRWRAEIVKAINNGAYFIACFSVVSENRDQSYMREEVDAAIDSLRRRPRHRNWFIPVMLSSIDLPREPINATESLADLHFIRLYDDLDRGIAQIKTAVGVENPAEARARNLSNLLTSSFASDRVTAMEALRKVEYNYDFVLARLCSLARNDPAAPVRHLAVSLLKRIPALSLDINFVFSIIEEGDETIRKDAVDMMYSRGLAAIPLLVERLDQGDRRSWGPITAVLGRFGSNASAASERVAVGLNSEDPEIQIQSLTTLARINYFPRASLPALIDLIKFGARNIRLPALELLASVGCGALEALPLLKNLASSPDAEIQVAAARAIGAMGSSATSATHDLLTSFESASLKGKIEIIRTLGLIGGTEQVVLAFLVGNLGKSREIALASRSALQDLGRTSLTELLKVVASEFAVDESTLASILEEVPLSASESTYTYITDLISGNSVAARITAARLAKIIGPAAGEVAVDISRLLYDSNTEVREVASSALMAMGPGAYRATENLIEMLGERSILDRHKVASVLASISPKALFSEIERLPPELIDTETSRIWIDAATRHGVLLPPMDAYLVDAFRSGDAIGKRRILSAVAKSAGLYGSAEVLMEAGMGDQDAAVRAAAGAAFGEIPKVGASQIALLIAALGDRDATVALEAGRSLGKHLIHHTDMCVKIASRLEHSSPTLKIVLLRALGTVKEKGREAVPHISRHMGSIDVSVREASSQAISEILGDDVEAIIEQVENALQVDRRVWMDVMARLGAAGLRAIPYLREIAGFATLDERAAIFDTIRKIETFDAKIRQESPSETPKDPS